MYYNKSVILNNTYIICNFKSKVMVTYIAVSYSELNTSLADLFSQTQSKFFW